jgi:cytochrome P450
MVLFPRLHNVNILPFERENALNAASCRDCIRKLLKKRRTEPKNGNDLLSILLLEPLFANDDEAVVDELLTIFIAGGQTTAHAAQNLLMHLLKNPHYET